MEASTSKQAATHFSSHREDDRSARTWSGYRPDPQTARDINVLSPILTIVTSCR